MNPSTGTFFSVTTARNSIKYFPVYLQLQFLIRLHISEFINFCFQASKAAVLGFFEALRLELAPSVIITIVTLGFIESGKTKGNIYISKIIYIYIFIAVSIHLAMWTRLS